MYVALQKAAISEVRLTMPRVLLAIVMVAGILLATIGALTQVSVCSCPAQLVGQPSTCDCPPPSTYYLSIFIGASIAIISFAGLALTWKQKST
jgi:hypothetical protein